MNAAKNKTRAHPVPCELKICGITTTEDLDACARVGVDWVGLNLVPSSPRFLSLERAKALWENFAAKAEKLPGLVVVVTDPEGGFVNEIVAALPDLRVIQLHGTEQVRDLEALIRDFPATVKLWKAQKVADTSALRDAMKYSDTADLILFDGIRPGQGKAFTWEFLDSGEKPARWGIAGGISAGNVKDALARGPHLIDVCSGVEKRPGIKDHVKIEELVALVKA